MIIIRASVGNGGHNDPGDVCVVQRLLNEGVEAQGVALKIDGIAGPKTIAAILAFQKDVNDVVDGRIDHAGPTIKHLLMRHLQAVARGIDRGAIELARQSAKPEQSASLHSLMSEYLRMLREH